MTRSDRWNERLLSRRAMIGGTLAAVAGYATAAASRQNEFESKMAAIQVRIGGRIGAFVLDTGSTQQLSFHAADRFAMCSTFKLLLAAQVLAHFDAGKFSLGQRVPYGAADLLATSPITSKHVGEGALSVRELCEAIVTVSDNGGANLLLNLVGGPASLTAFLRSQGDEVTRLDRKELELNTNIPGDPRDTSTPAAMSTTVAGLLTGNALSATSRELLLEWMKRSPTGVRRLRAGVPANWIVGDKTGTGRRGAVNDVMIATPPGRKPIVATVFMSDSTQSTETLEAAHKDIGACIAEFS